MFNKPGLPQSKQTAATRNASRRRKDRVKTGIYAIVIALLTAEINFDLVDRLGYRIQFYMNSRPTPVAACPPVTAGSPGASNGTSNRSLP